MGVTGLWTVVQPCARPIKIETLNRKRLAVDASIWIYQFLKAVRDKEGNALRNSHVVGFFRRICKLLYYGIKPVFVFDGGAPSLKRQTIAGRKRRREGRREDAARTAGKLLAVQIQRQAEEEAARRRNPVPEEQEEVIPENLVYAEEVHMTAKERQQNRQFRKKDAYHLPEMDVSLEKMGAPDDPRIMSHEELEEYARQFHSGEEINLYDFSKIDFNSPFFQSLPASDRYNILNAARLRSRLRMGYSKEQLDTMFPDRMAFSRFQIERVKERNDLTQRLMNINGMNGEDAMYGIDSGSRIAGERGKEYVLVKNNSVEGGWVLGVVGNKNEGQRDRPIDVDQVGQPDPAENDEWEDEAEGFENVPIEGLNRLPKLPMLQKGAFDAALDQNSREIAERRRTVYQSRREAAEKEDQLKEDADDALFVADEADADQQAQNNSEINALFEQAEGSDDDDLRRAIEMSLESPKEDFGLDYDFEPSLSTTNPALHDTTEPAALATALETASEDEDDGMDFATALAQAKKIEKRHQPSSNPFSGPLPFESLSITKLPSKDKSKSSFDENEAGGFEPESSENKPTPQPLPPWFTGGAEKKGFIDEPMEDEFSGPSRYREKPTGQDNILRQNRSTEVIDVDAEYPDIKEPTKQKSTIDVKDFADNQSSLSSISPVTKIKELPSFETIPSGFKEPTKKDSDVTGEAVLESTLFKPSLLPAANPDNPVIPTENARLAPEPVSDEEAHYEWEPSDEETETRQAQNSIRSITQSLPKSPSPDDEDEDFEDVDLQKLNETEPMAQTSTSPMVGDLPAQEQPEVDMNDFVDDQDYSDPEDQELMHQLAVEAEEHARFASTLNQKSQAQNAYDYEQELKQLRAQQKKDRRDADEVSQIMITECQQLLQLFGLPYITAPMEAEAQCAELVSLGLVDGIITDDSDVFLFGGTRVYKNFFNQGKFVECYLRNDLEKEYALDRQKLIRFAHLLGSDYTEGIPGVGPVTALEILTEFDTLEDFRDWWTQVQMGAALPDDTYSSFRRKFKKNATKLFLPPVFPDTRVDEAYLEPEVDSDPSAFQWGVPDLNALRHFLMSTIGWSQERTDDVLVPVIKDMNRRETEGTQSNITGFFGGAQGAGAFAPRARPGARGRMEKAFDRLRGEAARRRRQSPDSRDRDANGDVEDTVEMQDLLDAPTTEDVPVLTQTLTRKRGNTKVRAGAGEDENGDDEGEEEGQKRPRRKAGKRRRVGTRTEPKS